MIKSAKGNLFESHAEVLVNTVNTVGVMGKGIALQFKERFPDNYDSYRKACKADKVKIGLMHVTEVSQINGPKWIVNFPTKKHWKGNSDYLFIEKGLDNLVVVLKKLKATSIAIPPLGAGHGGLDWEKVKKIIAEKLEPLNDVSIELFEPSFTPPSEIKKDSVGLTKARALILTLMSRYRILGFETTHLEIQKLAYFLQRMGQKDLKLQYKKFLYGPFAYNLQHLLSYLEGSYLIGDTRIMDTRPLDNIYLMHDKLPEVEDFVNNKCSAVEKERIEKVNNLIEGFESPFGVELLATVDWVVSQDKSTLKDTAKLYSEVKRWNKRKAALITDEHISLALSRLSKYSSELYVH